MTTAIQYTMTGTDAATPTQWTEGTLESFAWTDGTPIILTETAAARLEAGQEVSFGSEWYHMVRLARVAAAPVVRAQQAATCVECGGPVSDGGARCGEC